MAQENMTVESEEIRMIAWDLALELNTEDVSAGRGWTMRTMTWDEEH